MIRVSFPHMGTSVSKRFEVAVKVFKGGEVNVVISNEFLSHCHPYDHVMVTGNLMNSDMVMAFFLTIDALRRHNPSIKVHAHIPYFPYARQDRVCNSGEALSVALFTKLLNAMELESVTLLDPHSDVTPALVNNSIINTQKELLEEILGFQHLGIDVDQIVLIAPDAGAVKKTKALTDYLSKEHFVSQNSLVSEYMTATKVRNLETLEITETRFDGDVKDRNVLVVDDICDGGRTFIELAKQLRAQGCKQLSLFVTHGIFSYGVNELMKWYDKVYTTDSFHPDGNSEIRQSTREFKDPDGVSRFHWSLV